jgi:hypothetical protein
VVTSGVWKTYGDVQVSLTTFFSWVIYAKRKTPNRFGGFSFQFGKPL